MQRRGRNLALATVLAVGVSGSALEAGQAQRPERALSPARTLWQWVVTELKAANPWAHKVCEAGSSIDPNGCPFAASTAAPPGEAGSSIDPDG